MKHLKAIIIGFLVSIFILVFFYQSMRFLYRYHNYDAFRKLIDSHEFHALVADVSKGIKSLNEIDAVLGENQIRYLTFHHGYGFDGNDIKAVYELGGADHHYGMVISSDTVTSQQWDSIRRISFGLYVYDDKR